MITQKAAPLELQFVCVLRLTITGSAHLKYIQEARMAQLVDQRLLLLDRRKVAGHQLSEALVLRSNHVPHILQVADSGLTSAERTVVLDLDGVIVYVIIMFLI